MAVIDFSYPILYADVTYLIPKPILSADFLGITKPFDNGVFALLDIKTRQTN